MKDLPELIQTLNEYNKICPEGYKLRYVYGGLGNEYFKCQYDRTIFSISPTSDGMFYAIKFLKHKIAEIEKKRSLETFKPAIRELYKLCDVNKEGFVELVKSAIAE